MSKPDVYVTTGKYPRDNPRWGLMHATLAHWGNIAGKVHKQPGFEPKHQRQRYITALKYNTDPFVTISDDDVFLRPIARRRNFRDKARTWYEYVQWMFDRHPEYGYFGPWLTADGPPPKEDLFPMSVVGQVRFVRQGCLDPNDMLPMLEGCNGYDMQIAKMLQSRGWKCAKLSMLPVHHLGSGITTIRNER
jgi:hypothetical protein